MDASGANCSARPRSCAHAASRARRRAPSTSGGGVGQVAGDRLERPDRRRRTGGGSWRTRRPWPGPRLPMPTRAPLMRTRHSSTPRSKAGRAAAPARSTERAGPRTARSARGEHPRFLRARPSGPPRTRTSSSSSMATSRGGDAPGGHELGHALDGGRRATVPTVAGSAVSTARHSRPRSPASARARAATAPSMKGTGARNWPTCSQISSRSRSEAPPPPSFSDTPMAGPTNSRRPPTAAGRSRPVRWPARHRRAAVGEEGRTASTTSCCSAVRFRSMIGVHRSSAGWAEST